MIFTSAVLPLSNIYAEGIEKTVTVYVNSVIIQIDGNPVGIPNITYEGGIYVPVRDISEYLGRRITWNDTARTVNIYQLPVPGAASDKLTAVEVLKGIAYLISAGFLIAGALLLAQMLLMRGRSDIAFIMRLLSSSGTAFSGVKRLVYETSLSKTGFIYILFGIILGFLSTGYHENFDILLRVILICMCVFALLLLGWKVSKNRSARQCPEIMKLIR
ncbi:MAG: stalk domain-containing protein [Eubacteriales bacterium]|nr:stalk domain-containing protein [Eubacteriales bacterium]